MLVQTCDSGPLKVIQARSTRLLYEEQEIMMVHTEGVPTSPFGA